MHTFLLVYSQYNNNLVPANANEFVDASDSSPLQLAQEDHPFDVVVFKEFDVCAHFGDLTDLDDDKLVQSWELILVESAIAQRPHDC